MNAILIIAHKNIEQIKKLISVCVSNETIVFLHLDKKMQITQQEFDDLKRLFDGKLFFANKRISGELDTRSLVDIVLLLLDKTKEVEKDCNIKFKYYLLLSGQDYLTKPIDFINKELKTLYPKPLIDCTPYDKSNWLYYKFRSNCKLLQFSKVINKIPKKDIRYLFRLFLKSCIKVCNFFLKITHKTDYYYFKKNNINLYGGSAWWILPDKIINYILEEKEISKKWFTKLLGTFTPEETFFQTLTMKSDLKDLVEINPIDMIG